jgi:uncharacterized protein (TIGR03067 family)
MYRRPPGPSLLLASLLALLLLGSARSPLAAQEAKKTKPPSAKEVAEATKLVKDLYKQDYAEAQDNAAARVKLAATLLKQAKDTKDEAAARFVLLREARDLAAQGGDLTLANEAIEETNAHFAVNLAELKAAAILAAAPVVSADKGKAVVELTLEVLSEVLQQDNLDTAHKLLKAATELANRSKSLGLLTRIEKRRAEVQAVEKALAQVKEYAEALKKNPEDAKANLEMGKYLCLLRGNWDKGLPLLAKGSDEELKALAKKDLSKPKSSKAQAALGDAWWARSEGQKEPAKLHLQARAAHWYEQALPDLSGIAKVKVAKRVEEYSARAPRKVEVVDAKSELKKLEGTWTIEEIQGIGMPLPKELFAMFKLIVKDNKISVDLGGFGPPGQQQALSFKIDPTKKPKHIDLIADDGPQKGMSIPGIYALEGNTLRICACDPMKGKGRPANFPKVPSQDEPIIVLKRAK